MKRIWILLVAILLLCTGCVTIGDDQVPSADSPNALLFEDNFDGTVLDNTKWKRCPEWNRQGTMDVWDDDMAYLNGEGQLILKAVWNKEERKIHSGAVRSRNRFLDDYAYYEASIKFPTAKGIWGAFWIMAGDVSSEKDGAVDGVEIDIIESINADKGICNSALHWDGYDAAHRSIGKEYFDTDIYDGEFHTFGLWRTEEAYIFYIDGEETWRVTAEECDICTELGYMKLSVEGADWAGAGTKKSINSLPDEMVVDWVRVWREKPITD